MNENIQLTPTVQETQRLSHQAISFMQLSGLNPLVSAAMPLLLLMIKLRQIKQLESQQISVLRHQLINEIVAFVEAVKKLQYQPRIILAARYCLCTALDEAILSTNWGNNSAWSHQTLLSIIQKETWGGERFFIILEEMAKSPMENLALLELLYLILSLGFEGRYYNQEQATRDEVRHRLFYLISLHKEEPEKVLSPSLSVLQKTPAPSRRIFSRWKMLGITFAVFMSAWLIFNVATGLSGHEVLQALNNINQQLQNAAK
ncbi:MAG TPA: type IVB secretion system protein IcmH/DotU [Gammaproteobacteria bacterium]|nr:type IVB secretion system protein IcmH/DotU [Gammaproteobacteria bacterium]